MSRNVFSMYKSSSELDNNGAEIYEHQVDLKKRSISYSSVDWCKENCKGKWSWWFDTDSNCHLTFEYPEDLYMWTLKMYDREINGYHKRSELGI